MGPLSTCQHFWEQSAFALFGSPRGQLPLSCSSRTRCGWPNRWFPGNSII